MRSPALAVLETLGSRSRFCSGWCGRERTAPAPPRRWRCGLHRPPLPVLHLHPSESPAGPHAQVRSLYSPLPASRRRKAFAVGARAMTALRRCLQHPRPGLGIGSLLLTVHTPPPRSGRRGRAQPAGRRTRGAHASISLHAGVGVISGGGGSDRTSPQQRRGTDGSGARRTAEVAPGFPLSASREVAPIRLRDRPRQPGRPPGLRGTQKS